MSCGEFQQVRLGEFLDFKWTDAVLDEDPLDLADAVDVGKGREVTVTILVTRAVIASGGSMELVSQTAAVNNATYYGTTSDDALEIASLTSGPPVVYTIRFALLSRFWLPKIVITGSPSGESSLSCTIDVVIR